MQTLNEILSFAPSGKEAEASETADAFEEHYKCISVVKILYVLYCASDFLNTVIQIRFLIEAVVIMAIFVFVFEAFCRLYTVSKREGATPGVTSLSR